MKNFYTFMLLMLLSIAYAQGPAEDPCQAALTVNGYTVASGSTIVYYSYGDISLSNYTVAGGTTGGQASYYSATSIQINPDTYISAGGLFLGVAQTCLSSPDPGRHKAPANTITGLQLYPNPASDKVTLSLQDKDLATITILSIEGKTMFSKKIPAHSHETNIEVSNYGKGEYFVISQATDGTLYKEKLIVP